jgi:peptide deformylase
MIITDENLLRKECKDASIFEASEIITKLEYELKNSTAPGIGLAASQIGFYFKIFILRTKHASLDFVNPKIIDKRDLRLFKNEGCLSFPGIYLTTKRFNEIFVVDLFHPNGIICTGLEAVVVQHETGHVYGETMFDYQVVEPQINQKCWCNSGIKYKRCHMEKFIL